MNAPWIFLIICLCVGIPSGFTLFSRGSVFSTATGQVIQGLLSILCFLMIGIGFYRYGWRVGSGAILAVFVGTNIGVTILKMLTKK